MPGTWIEQIAFVACWLPVLLWVPSARLFWTNWRLRGNPLSLASFNAIVGGMYLGPAAWFAMGRFPRAPSLIVMMGLNVVIASSFLVAMWSARKFPDQRKPPGGQKEEFP